MFDEKNPIAIALQKEWEKWTRKSIEEAKRKKS